MKPYQLIQNQRNVIDSLRFELKHSKDKVRDAKRINTLIDTITGFEEMLMDRYYTEAIETLLYARIYSQLIANVESDEINIYGIVSQIDQDIEYGSKLKKDQVVSFLKQKELEFKIDQGKVFDKYADFDKMLTELINEFKQSVVWIKK